MIITGESVSSTYIIMSVFSIVIYFVGSGFDSMSVTYLSMFGFTIFFASVFCFYIWVIIFSRLQLLLSSAFDYHVYTIYLSVYVFYFDLFYRFRFWFHVCDHYSHVSVWITRLHFEVALQVTNLGLFTSALGIIAFLFLHSIFFVLPFRFNFSFISTFCPYPLLGLTKWCSYPKRRKKNILSKAPFSHLDLDFTKLT